jgi:hypothetical protein
MSRGPGPHLLAKLSSGVVTCSSALDLAFLPRWAPALPYVPQLRTSPPCRGGFRCCHMALPPQEESFGAGTCSSAPDLAYLPRWAPVLLCGPCLASPRGELQCCHVPHGPQRAVGHRNKERPNCPRHIAGLTCFQSMIVCYQDTYKTCG